jgi:cyclic pyranopterin phosphate synthase
MKKLSHIDAKGRAAMVDVGAKPPTRRVALACGEVRMTAATLRLAKSGSAKGDVFAAARIAGIMAAKRTPELIPLCHPLALEHIKVDAEPFAHGIKVTASCALTGRTGVEMEALTAVSVACLTIYDMLKAAERGMTITNMRLLHKSGGRSGTYDAK